MRRGSIVIAVVVALGITALWWLFLVSPRAGETADVEESIEAERTREATLRQQIGNLQRIKDQEVSYLFAIGQMESAIPELPQIDAFLEEMNFLAARTGVTLSSISLATPAPPGEDSVGPLSINITMSVEGQYFEMLGFFYGLEAMERLVRVETISLTPQESTPDVEDPGPGADDGPENLAEGPRPRPDVTTLSATIGGVLFTRTPAVVEVDPAVTTTTVPAGTETTTTTLGDGE